MVGLPVFANPQNRRGLICQTKNRVPEYFIARHFGTLFVEETAMGLFRIPGRIYDSIYGGYGWFGVAFAALGLVLLIIAVMVWFDRRK